MAQYLWTKVDNGQQRLGNGAVFICCEADVYERVSPLNSHEKKQQK